MSKVIPILPCNNLENQIAFYEALGFICNYRLGNYIILKYDDIELHFYYCKILPEENANMCYIRIDEIDKIHNTFTTNYEQIYKKVPKTGFPRITEIRPLTDDRRFTISDISGNTIYVGCDYKNTNEKFLRTISHKVYKKNFFILYDLIYSKEDLVVASNMLKKFFPLDAESMNLEQIDLAKFLLVLLEIKLQKKEDAVDLKEKISELYNTNKTKCLDWEKIIEKYNSMIMTQKQ